MFGIVSLAVFVAIVAAMVISVARTVAIRRELSEFYDDTYKGTYD